MISQQIRDVDPLLVERWSSVADAGPTFKQQRVNISSGDTQLSALTEGSTFDLLIVVMLLSIKSRCTVLTVFNKSLDLSHFVLIMLTEAYLYLSNYVKRILL